MFSRRFTFTTLLGLTLAFVAANGCQEEESTNGNEDDGGGGNGNTGNTGNQGGTGNTGNQGGTGNTGNQGGDAGMGGMAGMGGGGMGGDAGMGGGGSGGGPIDGQGIYTFGLLDSDTQSDVALFTYPGAVRQVLAIQGIVGTDDIDSVAASPDGLWIAVSGNNTGGTERVLHIYPADGSGAPVVIALGTTGTNDAASFRELAFSPDSARIAYRSDTEVSGRYVVYVAPTAGGTPIAVSPIPDGAGETANDLAWANATTLVYQGPVETAGISNLWAVDVTTPVPLPLIPNGSLANNQGVSSAGGAIQFDAAGKVYFKSDHQVNDLFRMYRVDLDATDLEQVPGSGLLNNLLTEVSVGAWGMSPDGTDVAFSAETVADLEQVYVLDITTPSTANVVSAVAAAPLGAINGPPVGFRIPWSPDGTKLAVIADWTADNVTDVYILPTSGAPGGIRIIPPAIAAGDATDAAFSTDGSRLFVLGDLVTDTESELFTTTDFATAGQAAGGLILEDVPVDGDLDDDGLVPQP